MVDLEKKSYIKNLYENKYKVLLVVPFLMLILALSQISYQMITTGDFINKGVSLKGGITINVQRAVDSQDLQSDLREVYPDADINVRILSRAGDQIGVLVEASDVESKDFVDTVVGMFDGLDEEEYSVEAMGSSLGESFFRETFIAIIFAFLFMAIVVFAYFRTVVPSMAVVLSAFSDIVTTVAIVNITGMKLGTAGIAAFLMLIGYSVDTDILLSTKVLKRKEGSVIDGIYTAMKTGLTMSITTMVALSVALIFTQSVVLKQIMIILLIGLVIDLVNTWIQNAGILRLYLERKDKVRDR